ncbi:hypothetical protein PA08_0039 [Cutibacterium modestum P08]|nr:hypothetical protein PA08_0039 [Cutibacterium modestum P08]
MSNRTTIICIASHPNLPRHLTSNKLLNHPINNLTTSRLNHIRIQIKKHTGIQINLHRPLSHPLTTSIRNITSRSHQRVHKLRHINTSQILRIQCRLSHTQRHTLTPTTPRRLLINSGTQQPITHRHIMKDTVTHRHINPLHISRQRRSTKPTKRRMPRSRSPHRRTLPPVVATHLATTEVGDRAIQPPVAHINDGPIGNKVAAVVRLGTPSCTDEVPVVLKRTRHRSIHRHRVIHHRGIRKTPHSMQRQNHRPRVLLLPFRVVILAHRNRINQRHRRTDTLIRPRRQRHKPKDHSKPTNKTCYPHLPIPHSHNTYPSPYTTKALPDHEHITAPTTLYDPQEENLESHAEKP